MPQNASKRKSLSLQIELPQWFIPFAIVTAGVLTKMLETPSYAVGYWMLHQTTLTLGLAEASSSMQKITRLTNVSCAW